MNEGLGLLGVRATWALAQSALPDAPVVPDPAPRRPRLAGIRAEIAGALRRIAAAVEPAPRPRAAIG